MLGGTCENDHDGIPPTESPCQRKELLNLLAKRHALAVAVSSVLCKITQCSGEDFSRFVTLNRQLRDLELMLMDIELKVMDLFQHGKVERNELYGEKN
mmetsp:Transcript_4733/g.6934  ORF Transcript_4733/g.6934 Transcript_4733/m.6934 type:complete len:98 (+) Transcript_4733:131-424(+)